MKVLGYSLTWRTSCFLDNGCGQKNLFAHTNGDGDFVLFDALGWPWPIHDCYANRFEIPEMAVVMTVRGSRAVRLGAAPARTWEVITLLEPDPDKHRGGLSIIGTVTNVEEKFVGRAPQFAGISNRQRAEVTRTLGEQRDFVVVATGDGFGVGAFVDLGRSPVKFRDTVAAKLKVVRLLNQAVFVATQLRVFRFDGT